MALAAAATADPDTWGPLAFTSTPLAPIVDGQVLLHAPLRPFPEAAAKLDLLLGYCKDEYAAFLATLPGLHPDPEVFTSAIGFPQVSHARACRLLCCRDTSRSWLPVVMG